MYISEDSARARLESENNLANRFGNRNAPPQVQEEALKQPGKDRSNLTVEERTEIATRARLGENQEELGKEFGVTQENVSQIKNGKVKGVDEDKVNAEIAKVRDKALDRLMTSLGLITDDKLSGCNARDLSTIAANMGRVVEKTMPKVESNDRVNIIIYSPEIKDERTFKTLEI